MSRSVDPRELLARLEQLEQVRSDEVGQSKRGFRRFVVRGDVMIEPVVRLGLEGEPVGGMLRDVGLGGIGFISPARYEPGTLVYVEMLVHGYTAARPVLVIRHCRQVEGDLCLAGGNFCAEPAQLLNLGVDPAALRCETGAEDVSGDFASPSEA